MLRYCLLKYSIYAYLGLQLVKQDCGKAVLFLLQKPPIFPSQRKHEGQRVYYAVAVLNVERGALNRLLYYTIVLVAANQLSVYMREAI